MSTLASGAVSSGSGVAGTLHALKLGGHVSAGTDVDAATGTHQHSSSVPSEQLPAVHAAAPPPGSPEKPLAAGTLMRAMHFAQASPSAATTRCSGAG